MEDSTSKLGGVVDMFKGGEPPVGGAALPAVSEVDLNLMADKLLGLRQLKEVEEKELTETKGQIEDLEQRLVAAMQALDRSQFDYQQNLFYLSVQSFPRVIKESDFLSWLEEKGEAGIIKRAVNSQTLRAWYKENSAKFSEELLGQGLIEVPEKIRVNVRKR